MEETGRDAPATGNVEAASHEAVGEGSRRRPSATKRKGLSGSSSSYSSSSKRLAKERNLPSFHSYTHNGPVTRARQSPNKYSATGAAPHGLAEQPAATGAAVAAGCEENPANSDWMEGENEETDAMCEPVVDPDFDAVRTRGSNVHVVPTHAGWFSWEKIHHLEKQSMDSFFNGKSEKRTADVYHEIRNSIVEKFHSDPLTDIEEKHLAELDIGEKDERQEVMEFLDHWGLINFHPFPPSSSNPSVSKTERPAKAETLSERLFQFEVSYPTPRLASKRQNPSAPAMPARLYSESTLFDDLVRPEGPSVEYHCNSCSGDCSRKRYHCQKQADFDLCTDCFNNGKFGSGMTSSDFILMEPAEAAGTGGASWTDQETLLLLEALELYGENWNEIAEHVATKTRTQCMLHFVKMPIEDRFLTDDVDINEKNEDEKIDSVVTESEDKQEKEKGDCKTETVQESNPSSSVISALKTAHLAAGSGVKEGEPFSFAEAGNPVMTLAAFLVALVDHDLAFTSSRSSIRAMTEESAGIQLAMRHCFALEDPPKDQKDQQGHESQGDQVEVAEKVNDERPSLSSGECAQRKEADGVSAGETADKRDTCSNDLNPNGDGESNAAVESRKTENRDGVLPGSADESKSKDASSPKGGDFSLTGDQAPDLAKDSGHGGGKEPSEASKSQNALPPEENERSKLDSDSAPAAKEPSGGDDAKSAASKGESDSKSLKAEDEASTTKFRRAAVSALSAAAVNAKLFVDQEEGHIRRLASLVIEKQLRKLEVKLGLFGEIEGAISRAREQLDRARQRLLHERAQIITSRLGLPPSSSRSIPASLPAAKLAMAQSLPSPRPSVSLTPHSSEKGTPDSRDNPRGYRGRGVGFLWTIIFSLLFLIFLAGVVALVLYLVYRPSEPRFTVNSASFYDLNATAGDPTVVSASLQFTLAIRNPSERSSIVYDRLEVFVAYRDQAITPATPLPPLYQEKDSTVLVSPALGGVPVPVSPEVARGLAVDRAFGLVSVNLVVHGRLKYKAGPFRSPWYGLYVKCDLLVGVKKGMSGQVPLLGAGYCSVHT